MSPAVFPCKLVFVEPKGLVEVISYKMQNQCGVIPAVRGARREAPAAGARRGGGNLTNI